MGTGTSSGKATGGVYTAAASKYQNIADSNAAKSAANPNNLTYKGTADLYSGLAKAANGMNPNVRTFSGSKAVVALDNAPVGTRVEISGTNNDGTYVKENWTQPGYISGTVWRREGDAYTHSFASNPSTITSNLGLRQGGKLVDDKNRKVRFL